ncbi:HNH endonuclease signature motif containing protein [Geodermatophilus ruber]|uniref:DUF222 domain-containing protein n=1 Tax=Geodermatophilus ruber TaxID=504800 RepID=A0A1I4HVV8_9ACTN|nr:HNH endonuclease signature motif containing protein [Geodermatophilus ruber]SFL45980.1 hypothetical protein SAMN04488085_111139 [Geodermatophilus ruber]
MFDDVAAAEWFAGARTASSERRRRAAEPSTEWPAFAPPVELAPGPLGRAQAAARETARQFAVQARAVAEFAATRPAAGDRAQGEPGAMSAARWAGRAEVLRPVSEWAAQELMIACSLSLQSAEALVERSLTLVQRLPGTLAALEAGALHPGHVFPLLEIVAPIGSDRVRGEVEAEVLRWAAGRVISPAQLADKARREATARDARATARRLAEAIKRRGVSLRPERTPGMATVTAVLTVPEARALYRALAAMADALDDPADPRGRGQKMADCLLDLVLRPGESGLVPVQVLLTVVASVQTLLGGDQPGEIDGQTVPAEMVRQLIRAVAERGVSAPLAVRPDPARPTQRTPVEPLPPASPAEDPVWQEIEQRELTAWWAETERRVLAGELIDALEPIPDEVLAAWAAEAGEEAVRADLALDEPADAVPGDDPPAGDPADRDPWDAHPANGDPPGPGWWAAADRALDDASQALLRAQRALAHASRTVRTAECADAADEAAWRAGPAGRVTAATSALAALHAAAESDRRWLAELLGATAGGGLADRPRIAVVDELTGALVALTDSRALRRLAHCGRPACRRRPERCAHDLTGRPGLGPPPPTDGHDPETGLDRFVRARDRRCRFPGCRRPVRELDHHTPWPVGATSAANLTGFCTGDHRGKHQAPGWAYTLTPDGTLTVTTPTGLVATTEPPPF